VSDLTELPAIEKNVLIDAATVVWIGGHAVSGTPDWHGVNGEPWSDAAPWLNGGPGSTGNCLGLVQGYQFHDLPREEEHRLRTTSAE
jgi:hypothetical protein